MVRTNIVIDEDLVTEVMRVYGLGSRRSAVDFALHAVLSEQDEVITDPWKAMLELEGTWADMPDEEVREIWGFEPPSRDRDRSS